MIVSDYIAQWLEEKDVRHAFGIIGAGNAAIFDSVASRGFTQIVCVHHEQAATMASQSYWRTCGRMAVSLVTTGGGSANAVTGVVGAWMDSIPLLVISGNEAEDHCETNWRGWGVQGFDSVKMVKDVTKFSERIYAARSIKPALKIAYEVATNGRPGPCWVDVPRDIQQHALPED